MAYEDAEKRQLGVGIAVVLLSIAAIISFFLLKVAFYVLAVLTILAGAYMAYLVSQEGKPQRPPAASAQRSRRNRKSN